MKAKVRGTEEIIDVELYECNYMDWGSETLYWDNDIEILEKPREREMGKFASIDASGVKEIAEMQRYIDNLENYLWRMAMFIKGQDDGKTVLSFTEKGSKTGFATDTIYDFIKEHREEKK